MYRSHEFIIVDSLDYDGVIQYRIKYPKKLIWCIYLWKPWTKTKYNISRYIGGKQYNIIVQARTEEEIQAMYTDYIDNIINIERSKKHYDSLLKKSKSYKSSVIEKKGI